MTATATPDTERTCNTCGHTGPDGDFYASVPECRQCKRTRSRANRAVIADKVALADRLLALLEQMANNSHLCLGCAGLGPSQAKSNINSATALQ